MTDLGFTFLDQSRNLRLYELHGTTNIRVTSHGKDDYQRDNEISISFINIATGEYPVITLNGIEYTVNYATGKIDDNGKFARVTGFDLRRSEGGYFGTPPTQKARSAIFWLVSRILEDTADSVLLGSFLGAGQQVKARKQIERIEEEISETIDKYREKISALNDLIDKQGDVAGLVADDNVRFNVWGVS